MRTRFLPAAALLCAVAAAAAQAPQPAKSPPANAATGEQPKSEAEQKRRAEPVASYKGGRVTVGELEDSIARQNAFMRSRYKDKASLKDLLDKTLRLALLSDEAARRGYDKDEVVRQSVKQNSVQLLLKADLDDKLSAASIPKPDVEKYYNDHIDEYVQPAMQRASHVLVATEQEAKTLLAQAKTMDLRAFRQLARDKSTDQATKLNGGDLRYFDAQGKTRGDSAIAVPPAIAKAAFALKTIGDTAKAPVKTDAGYSIVKLTGQRPALSRKLSEVEETIRARLWNERRQAASEQLVQKLRDQYKPEIHAELLDAIKLEEPTTPSAPPGLPQAH